ncbi:major facilitator superfamily protein [Salinarchaeum sp. Harcht-Bsk1]|uniref:MFS transporter n=1 Tax=Salinarchaeum sp. Harcht-Bsk1 TaxID=1333523 RepID=UPI0003423AFF|nr:MFS transporter [Salinarchaeum sp. Harcht-Bsk1]AGN00601.1 major facilitator superfamily protein [Salinarchaeum sp. Harcht-Bsk1]
MNADRRVLAAVVASTFFVGFGGGVVFPILPNLGTVLGISPFLVGVILSTNRFVRLVANAPAGALVDRIGTRTPFVAGLAIEGVATTGYLLALWMDAAGPVGVAGVDVTAAEWWFILARVLWGLGSALVFATAYTIATDVSSGGSRGMDMGIVRGGILLGFPAGLVMGGVVSDLASVEAAFGIAAAFALFASVLAHVSVPETHVASERSSVKPWEVDTAIPTLTVGAVNFAVLFAYIGALFATLVLFLEAIDVGVFGLNAQGSSGVFMAVTVLAAAVSMLGGGKASDLSDSRVPILLGFLGVSVIGFLLLAAVDAGLFDGVVDPAVALVVGCVFVGAGQGGVSGPMTALLADLTPAERTGRAMGTNNVFGDVGGGLGPLISLPLIDVVGFGPIYAACAFLPAIAAVVLVVGVYAETGSVRPGTASVATPGPAAEE